MNNFSSLIDQIRDPLQMILLDCRAIGALISREDSFQFEMEKTINDSTRLFNIVNTFLSFHIFKDGQVRVVDGQSHQPFDVNAKKFYLESFIQGCTSFRSSLVSYLCTSRSIDQCMKNVKYNRTMYSLLRSKLFSHLMLLTESTRSLIHTCEVNGSSGGGDKDAYTNESISIISSNFLVQMKSLTETIIVFPQRDIFNTTKLNYIKSYNSFLELLKSCVFDISQYTTKLSQYCDELVSTSTMLYERGCSDQQQQQQQQGGGLIDIQGKNTLETNVLSIIETIKKIYPIISQSVNRIPSNYPLPTSIPFINIQDEEEIANENQRKKEFDIAIKEVEILSLKKEDQEEEEEEEEEEVVEKTATGIPIIKIDRVEQSSNSQSTSTSAVPTPSPTPPPTRWGIDLPTIVLTDLSDDEDDEPMIWSVPVTSFSPSPSNTTASTSPNPTSSNPSTPNNPSPRNSIIATQPTKVYNSKDFDINNLNKKSSNSGNKIGSLFKNPFKSSKDKEKDKKDGKSSSSSSSSPSPLPGTMSPPGSTSSSSSPQLSSVGSSANVSPSLDSHNYKSSSSPNMGSLSLRNGHSPIPPPSSTLVVPPSTGHNVIPNNDHLSLDEDLDDNIADTLEIPIGLRGSVSDPQVTLFEQSRDYYIEDIGEKSKRYSDRGVVIGFDNNERHIAHYSNYFYQQDHYNYICKIIELGGNVIISIKKEPERDTEKQHRCLILTSNGLEKLLIYSVNNKESNLIKGIQNYLKPICSIGSSSFKPVKNDRIAPHLVSFEKMELTTKYHFYLLFHGDGMTSEKEMLNNDRVSKEFIEFYKFLGGGGKTNQTKGWKKYAGGLDTSNNVDGETMVHCEMSGGIEIVFHVANLIPQKRRKEIMERNTIVIVYHEGKQPLSPSLFNSPKNQIIFDIRKIKVDPQSVYYKLGVSSHHTISPFGPLIQSPPFYKKDNHFKQFLLTKLINGENSAYSTGLLNQSLANYRAQKIEEIIMSL